MKLPIHFTQEALQEEVVAYLFYEEQQAQLGERFLTEVEKTLLKVSQNPAYYSFLDATKTIRDVRLNKFPFVIIFEVKAGKIIVYHIHHTRTQIE
jgi:hypothetical protein